MRAPDRSGYLRQAESPLEHQCALVRLPSQCEIERCTLVRSRFGPDAAAVTLHDALHERQSNAGAFVILGAVEPLKYAEQLVCVAHVEAHSVVAHPIHRLARGIRVANLDPRQLSLARVFQGIRHPVDEYLAYK